MSEPTFVPEHIEFEQMNWNGIGGQEVFLTGKVVLEGAYVWQDDRLPLGAEIQLTAKEVEALRAVIQGAAERVRHELLVAPAA